MAANAEYSGTALTSYVRAVRRAIDAAGCDSQAMVREAGLEPTLLEGPDARCSMANLHKLWQCALEATRDEAFGLRVASYYSPTTFHALSYSLVASATLKEAFERVVRYCHVGSDAIDYEFCRQGDEYHLKIAPVSSVQSFVELVDCLVAGTIRMCRSLLGYDYSPLRIELVRTRPRDLRPFERLLRTPCEFNARCNLIVFDRQTVERRLEGGNPELARHNDAIALQYLARMERDNVQARVRNVLVKRLHHGEPSLQQIAQLINVHERTLQRKLRECGVTYKQILDATRRELALAYLSSPRHSVGEVTYKLGFSANGSFTRAFRRWTGVAPTAWRAQGLGGDSSRK